MVCVVDGVYVAYLYFFAKEVENGYYSRMEQSKRQEPEKSDVAKKEEETLSFWVENDIFEKTLEKTKKGKPFVFYDGPPFATGTPHYGHLVASAMKDAVPRYQTMRGRYVERQWGWDCHGLPIENIVEKELGTKSKKEIEEIGIGKFNKLCREKIFTYVDEWNKFIPRFGRFADMSNPYRTMDASYMESEWWAFKKLYDKELIYKDYRSMHICPRCETTLAQSEVTEGYKEIKDLAVTVKFKIKNPKQHGLPENTFVLAWTTTPWTLPGNVALAVGVDIEYLTIIKGEENYIISTKVWKRGDFGDFGNLAQGKIITGKDLIGIEYEPLFDYYSNSDIENKENGWKIYAGDFVTTESGTGVVHIAPAFGEDDMELGKKEKLPFVQHIGMDGVIKPEVKELAGLSVKPIGNHQATDIEIIKYLAHNNLLFSKEKYEHSYPHCWRCDTPLLNYATSSWFVSVTNIKKDLLKYAKKINWSPSNIKEGRWADWLANARDWSISRQRFWANTIPVWENEETGDRLVVGSVEELKQHIKHSGNNYFMMRHGESNSNKEGYISNDAENSDHLTEKGREQVIKTAKDLKNKDINRIFASSFARTTETAEIVADIIGINKSDIVYDNRLWEVNTGDFNKRPIEEYRSYFKNTLEKFTKSTPGGETLNEMKNRLTNFLYETDKKYKDENILIIGHEYCAWLLFAGAEGMNAEEATDIKDKADDNFIENAEVRAIKFTPLPHNDLYELDLHRPYIDEIEVVDKNETPLKRVTDVLDTWFNSGSVPFSSYHYPFEDKKKVESRIPADFIAEGQDQVSKWFYYQHVLAGGLFKKHAFNNVIVNGIVLAEDGKKMSKRLQNYPNPSAVVDKFGADAVRFYLLSSPVVRADNLSFSEDGVSEVYKKLILRLQNVTSFYEMYYGGEEASTDSINVLDRWIIVRLNELIYEVTSAMDEYELDRAARPFMDFVDDLSTWYIRRSRDRFKSKDKEDKNAALATTRYVLTELAKATAPFMPFIAENIYKKVGGMKESVHLEGWPKSGKVDEKILKEMDEVRRIVSLGLEARAKAGIKVRQPLQLLKVKREELKDDYIILIKDEVNVKEVVFNALINNEVEIDTEITPELKKEGQFRELVRHIQGMRKKEKFTPSDLATIRIETEGGGKALVEEFMDELKGATPIKSVEFGDVSEDGEIKIDNMVFKISISK